MLALEQLSMALMVRDGLQRKPLYRGTIKARLPPPTAVGSLALFVESCSPLFGGESLRRRAI